MSKRLYIVSFISLLLSLYSCERRPLIDRSEEILVRVEMSVNTIVNVATQIYNEHVVVPKVEPELICVLFYDPMSHRQVMQTFLNTISKDEKGNYVISGNVKIQPGVYDMLCYNFDTSATLVRNDYSWKAIEAYTEEVTDNKHVDVLTRGIAGRITHIPDHLLVARKKGLRIDASSETVVIKTSASSIIQSYYVQLRLKNAQYVSTASAILTGLAPSNRLGENEVDSLSSSGVFFTMRPSRDKHQKAGEDDVLCAVFNTFGKLPNHKSQLKILLNGITANGKPIQEIIDMDEVFKTELAIKNHWLLLDQVIEVPQPDGEDDGGSEGGGDSSGGGFNPEVNDWEEERGEITI